MELLQELNYQSLFHTKVSFFVNAIFFRNYLPVLKNFPSKYIHEPWTAPESIQKAAKCIIGVDYPMPMVDHMKQSQHNIERMKQVYQQLTHYRGAGKPNLNILDELVIRSRNQFLVSINSQSKNW